MKNIIILFFSAFILCISCKKENNKNDTAVNTWSITPDGFESGSYRLKTIGLKTNVYQMLVATSEENQPSGNAGTNSTLTLYFVTVGPPPSGVYKVTSVEKLSGHPDCVAIQAQTFGDPRTGLSNTSWYSLEGSTQQISYEFKDGKASATLKDIAIKQAGGGPSTGTLSARISQ
ncbi:MAG: hypothetical protein ACTHMC_03860 [Pseudobacter sp.]|uniref:hypothetical protein n=1 Tax=Pseudobacter sp. TaxID=2045420 RepID=UPI003F7E835B